MSTEKNILQTQEFINNYPNPFNSESVINYSVKQYSHAKIKIFDLLGKEITTLLDKEISPGNYSISWEAKDNYGFPLPSGVYLIVLQTNNSIKTSKTILIK
ncbi:MAG: T9SS type A sorting domain-containing protein [Ignavibacterium sp.]|nr:T9SS type A sorting domain-containing protein [Ignavibacterium sp.]